MLYGKCIRIKFSEWLKALTLIFDQEQAPVSDIHIKFRIFGKESTDEHGSCVDVPQQTVPEKDYGYGFKSDVISTECL